MSRKNYTRIYFGCICIFLLASSLSCGAAENKPSAKNTDIVSELIRDIPPDFPRFEFAGHTEQAELLGHYLWYHFRQRMGHARVLFNKEYMLTSDIWLGNAFDRKSTKTVQDTYRQMLLDVKMDSEGYVLSQQHFSNAHDHGWPFPSWAQSDSDPDLVKGKAVGWFFQPLNRVRGWVGKNYLRRWNKKEYVGETAASLWQLQNVKSLGIVNNRWHLETTATSPAIITPDGYTFNAFDAPYLQLRWKRTGDDPYLQLLRKHTGNAKNNNSPYVEWLGENDTDFGADRRVYFYPDKSTFSKSSDCFHSIMTMYHHPKWQGKIKRVRICLAPGESDVKFEIESFFTVYDTRHTINNPILILTGWRYFNWTGDIDFLRRQINRMRLALRYQQTVLGGLKHNRIHNTLPGHDGLPSWHKDKNGKITFNSGHGIGANYWDILPFGWDDMYATNQYYAATVAMAELEEAILKNPGWNIPMAVMKLDPQQLRRHARKVKEIANNLFWSEETGRFVACIDKNGDKHDYGYTFLNLDSIWYDLADAEHSRGIMDWITGKRIVAGDTSTGEDIYRWRLGPRATTRRNIEWYGQGWYTPEVLDFGYQIQDGGAVLGFTFYDLWARLKILGPDNAWKRLQEILAWEKDVHSQGGYRKYYEGGERGTTLQGCGTCGGLGIDCEFLESSLLPAIIAYGFVGLNASSDGVLSIRPRPPKSCPEIAISNVLYHNVRFDIRVTEKSIEFNCKDTPLDPIRIDLAGKWKQKDTGRSGCAFTINQPGVYHFKKFN